MQVSERLLGAETEALLELVNGPWEIWTEGRESRIADLVLRNLCARGMASIERVNATLHRFKITDRGMRHIGDGATP